MTAVAAPVARAGYWRIPAAAVAVTGLAGSLAASGWLVLAAAARPSVLSPPTLRAPAPWLLGPLAGRLDHLSGDPLRLRADLTTALVIMLAGWLLAWLAAPALPVRLVAAAVAAAQLVFLLSPPQPLTDLFNYISYGRMAARGLNPYTALPLAGPHDAAYALSNWHHLPSPYGPLFTVLSEPLAALPLPAAYWTWKAIVVGCDLAALGLVWWLARALGRSPQRALVFAGLCPVTLAVGIGGFHNDALAMLCLLAGVACLVQGSRAGKGWDVGAGALAVLAAGIKPSLAIVVGLVVLGAHRRRYAALGALAAGIAVAAIVVFVFGGALPAIGIQDRLVNPLSLPNVLGVLTGHGGADAAVRSTARAALIAVVAVATLAVARRRAWALPAIGVVLLAGVLSLSWVMPWYLAWPLPLAALGRPRWLVALAVAGCVWLGVAGIPQMPELVHAIGWYPTRSATGHANHELSVSLVR